MCQKGELLGSGEFGEILANFRARISRAEFTGLQLSCQRLWLDYVSPEASMRHLVTNFGLPQTREDRELVVREVAQC